jgi:hypothetical protein
MMPRRLSCWLHVVLFFAVSAAASAQAGRWNVRSQRPGGFLWSIASDGNSRLVAVGTEGRILTSTDGIVWNARASGVTDWLVGVAYGYPQFIAVGDHGRILTSPDGETWKIVPNVPTTARLNNVFYGYVGAGNIGQGRWVAVGENGTALVSNDRGLTWQAGNTGVTGWLRGLTFLVTRTYFYSPYGGGTFGLASLSTAAEYAFVACGQGGKIVSSVDGLTWTPMDSGTTEDLEAITPTYSSGIIYVSGFNHAVAVGSSGVVRAYDAPNANFYGDFQTGYHGPPPALPPASAWIAGSLNVSGDVRLRGLARNALNGDYRTPILLASGERGVVVLEGVTQNTGVSQNLVASVFHQNKFYVVGEDETILQQADPVYHSTLGNLSTRGGAGDSRGILIGGLVVGGTTPKHVLVRAVGAGLGAFALTGLMPEPSLTGFDSAGHIIGANSGWADDPALAAAAASVGAFAFSPGSKDAAMVLTLPPGSSTFFVQPVPGTAPGVALFEAYDIDPPSNTGPQLLNVSTGGFVGGGAETLIGGFVISGTSRNNVLVRGIGPSLRGFGVTAAVDDCAITVYRGAQVIATNDDWGANPNATQLSFSFAQVGAFDLAADSKDAALILSNLAPGAYTVVLSGKGAASGRGMIEIYELP